MFIAKKKIIAGESSNLFTVSLLRFLILILFVILSFRAQPRNANEIMSQVFSLVDGDSVKNRYK